MHTTPTHPFLYVNQPPTHTYTAPIPASTRCKTKAACLSIAHGLNGFLPLLAGTSTGAIYGAGTYFHRAAWYSDDYAYHIPHTNHKQFFICEVVVGKWECGHPGMKMPNNLPGSTVKRYHSFVDNVHNPSIFVVQQGASAYPSYLVTYRA